MGWEDNNYNGENYEYTPEDMDTSKQYQPSQGVDQFLSNQNQNFQIDGNYFGQDQDWGNQNWSMDFGNDVGGMQQQTPQGAPFVPPQQTGDRGSIEGYLSKMFANPTMGAKLFGALFEGNQNKKRQSDLNSIANRQAFDPFGSQRPFYQQQLQNTVNDPYNQPMVKAQIDNVQRMQDIKDAAAGRRSNQLHSAPGVAAAQAEIAQKYMNSLQTPAGANLKPDSTALASLWRQASNSGIDGYTSPLLSVLGNGTRNMQTQDALEQLKAILGRT